MDKTFIDSHPIFPYILAQAEQLQKTMIMLDTEQMFDYSIVSSIFLVERL